MNTYEDSLDFYARIEPLFGFYETYDELYRIYLKEINRLFKGNKADLKALDFGCGNGKFTSLLSLNFDILGLDKSPKMCEICASKGIKSTTLNLNEIKDKFDLITAVSDVLNYLNPDELTDFFTVAYERLNPNGYLIFDLNTEFGFDSVASGSLYIQDNENDLVVDSLFENDELKTKFMYFEKIGDLYKKNEFQITQHYHDFKNKNTNLKQIKKLSIKLFSDSLADKNIYILQKIF
ncbi:SAM-dependent methyltransferase [Campylobacter iguaniorum]|uniref:class I SAM-dependent DNA methyltransferase n=1 Tax=Campylobacter iguaniorum TaxID=1244531 RepID=UPI0007C9A35E|nr:class I SAM-dependent methyltransferase [Campylobacter iguaniorum]ANE35723.1 SAM-dependent methyltransferase [Campylobacter iguaniorum]